MFVSTFIGDVERTPNYLDKKHAIEGMNFEDIANKVTDQGLNTINKLALRFKAQYGDLIGPKYNQSTFYTRSQYENMPIISCYGYFLSLYPETADGLSFTRGYKNIDTSNIPVTHDDIQNLRLRMNLELPYPTKQEV